MNGQKSNILPYYGDQQRYPPIYENEEIRSWRANTVSPNILARTFEKEFQASFV